MNPGDASTSLSTLLSAAAALSGSERAQTGHAPPDVASLLRVRLDRCYGILGEEGWKTRVETGGDGEELGMLQEATAGAALRLVEDMQEVLEPDASAATGTVTETSSSSSPPQPQQPPLLGTRDLSHVRTLLSIIFNWAVAPVVHDYELARHDGARVRTLADPRRIIDLTVRGIDWDGGLPGLTMRILALLFGVPPAATVADASAPRRVRQTWITASLLSRHAADVLRPGLLVGWAPAPRAGEAPIACASDVRTLVMRFINLLSPHEAISALGTVLASSVSAKRPSSHYVARACRRLLSDQLMRPDGVSGLCVAVFGEEAEEAGVAPLEKLEHVAKVLCTVPAAADPQVYYRAIIPRILTLLRPSSEAQRSPPPLHKRAAAFALSRMLSATFQNHPITSAILLPLVHTPFLSPTPAAESEQATPPAQPSVRLTAVEALQTLQTFLLHADPSPTELSRLLTPIAPEIYTLLSLHRPGKAAVDPSLRETLAGLLQTWGRIVSLQDAVDGLWRLVEGAGGHWEVGLDGFRRSANSAPPPSISLLAVAELEGSSKDDMDINSNPFNLRPDPSEFVTFLKNMNRSDAASEIFVRLLNEYRELEDNDEQPMRTLLCLQLILQIQDQLRTSVLSKPEHVLSFIRHALMSTSLTSLRPSGLVDRSKFKKGLGIKDLRIVKEEEGEEGVSEGGDSDDEDEGVSGATSGGGRDEMGVTAITLLLSVLEANEDLSPHNAPELNDILISLDHLTSLSHASPTIRQLAREAKLVLTARTASQSAVPPASALGWDSRARRELESAQATYQQALKLLQDPIIPVRAHGLQLLRDLVSRPPSTSASAPSSTSSPALKAPQGQPDEGRLDPALLPGILSIFLQSIQDDESYIYLNAVQGLAAMVDGYGREVLRGVVDVYLRGTGVGSSGVAGGGIDMSKEELDSRLRVGEALNTTVKRCGDALGLYVDILVPPLLMVLRSSHLPTALRTSALSILAQCMATNALAVGTYGPNLSDACVDLIQLESVPLKNTTPARPRDQDNASRGQNESTSEENGNRGNEREPQRQPGLMDSDPTTPITKAAALRRSALHFLSQLLRSHLKSVYDSRSNSSATIPSVRMSTRDSPTWNLPQADGAISDALLKRAHIVLGYVAATDEDLMTRVMAREASEMVEQYSQASLGF